MQTFISQGVKGVVMAPQDTAAIAPDAATSWQPRRSRSSPSTPGPTRGNVFMVVRADNRAYGTKACQFLGTKLGGKGKVVMLQGDLASINGRDRTEAFNECMKKNFPGITVFGEATDWDGDVAAPKLQTRLAVRPGHQGRLHAVAASRWPARCRCSSSSGLLVPPTDPKHVFVVSNDGIPEELKDIAAGNIDATVSQPADLYAKYGAVLRQGGDRGQDVPARPDRPRQHHHPGPRRACWRTSSPRRW